MGTDYVLVALGPYGHIGIKRTTSSAIPLDTPVLVAFKQYRLRERIALQADTLTLSGTDPVSLTHPGFLKNVWIPVSHGMLQLVEDADIQAHSSVPYVQRYMKVFSTDQSTGAVTVYREGYDYSLTVDPVLGPQISRFVANGTVYGNIAEGATVSLLYFTAETFTTTFTYPQFLTQLATAIAATKHGGADSLVKAMIPNFVDASLSLTVANTPSSSPTIVDPKVRTAVSLAMSMATKRLNQSDIVRLVSAVPGVLRVNLPLTRMAKADGSYILGEIIPTSTSWVAASQLNLPSSLFPNAGKAWITASPVLACNTVPSGALPNMYAGLLYEGQPYRRCKTLAEFANASDLAFYIIGVDDSLNATTPIASQHYGKVLLNTPGTTASPALKPYRVTYQVYGEATAQDIPISPLEYLLPGQVTISYEVDGQ